MKKIQSPSKGKSKGTKSSVGAHLLRHARAFLSRIQSGANLEEASLHEGIKISREIKSFFKSCKERRKKPEAELWQLWVANGKILISFKRFALEHNLSWKESAEKWFPHLSKRSRRNSMFAARTFDFVD